MLAGRLAEVVRPLISISICGSFAFEIVAEVEPARILTNGTPSRLAPNSGECQSRDYSDRRNSSQPVPFAGVLDQGGVLRVQKRALAFPESVKRAWFTDVEPSLQVWLMFSCWTRSSVRSPKPGRFAPPD